MGFFKTKKRGSRALAIVLSAATAITAPGISAIAETEAPEQAQTLSFIKADGKNLRTQSGQGDIINLRGTNAGGYLLQEFWMTPSGASDSVYDQSTIIENLTERFGEDGAAELINAFEENYWTEADFANCAGMGMNCIRLPFWWRNIANEDGSFIGYDENAEDPYAKAFERLDWFVQTAGKYGLYVILDMHGAPGSQNGSDHSGVDGKDTKEAASKFFFGDEAASNQELYYQLWKVIADRYEGNATVAGYDLLNEPYCTYRYNSSKSGDELHDILWNVYDKAYDVIRAEDPDHVIIMEATWDPVDLPNPDDRGWENVMYEYHNYLYDDYDNLGGGQILNMENKVNAIGNAGYNVPSYMGEFNYFNNYEAWDEGLQLLTEYGINWTSWTYKTVNNYGNWGLYHHPEYMDAGLDISTAQFDEIKTLWENSNTAQATANEELIGVMEKWLRTQVYENSTKPVEAEEKSEFLSGWQKLEAENEDVCTITGGAIEEQDFYSGGKAAGKMNRDETPDQVADDWSNINYLTFKIKAADKGTYPIVMHYNGDDDKQILVKAGDSDAQLVSVPRVADGTWNLMHDVVTYVKLDKGENTVKISGALGGGWMNIDYIATTNHYVTVSEHGAVKLEGEFFYSNGGLEGQTFFSGGKCVGNLNSNVAFDAIKDDWSNMKYVDFTIFAEKEGNYHVTWHWNGNGADGMVAAYKVNDGENVALTLNNKGASWDRMNSSDFDIHLNEGFNSFKLSGTLEIQDNWANIDCIDISFADDAEEPENGDGTDETEDDENVPDEGGEADDPEAGDDGDTNEEGGNTDVPGDVTNPEYGEGNESGDGEVIGTTPDENNNEDEEDDDQAGEDVVVATPVEENTPSQETVPAQENAPVQESTPVQGDAPVQVNVPEAVVGTEVVASGQVFSITGDNTVAVTRLEDSKAKSVKIPSTVIYNEKEYAVTEIGAKAFKGSKKLKTVTIPSSIVSIGSKAFYNCKKLEKVTIKANKSLSIGKSAFGKINKDGTIKIKGLKKKQKTKMIEKVSKQTNAKVK